MSNVNIHIINSWKPLENGQEGGNLTQLGPLCTARAILSPFSKMMSNGDFQKAIAYNRQPRDCNLIEITLKGAYYLSIFPNLYSK